MNKLRKLKLNEISFESLKEKEMRQVKGGDGCYCSAPPGSAGQAPNGNACSSYIFNNNFWGMNTGYNPYLCAGPAYYGLW